MKKTIAIIVVSLTIFWACGGGESDIYSGDYTPTREYFYKGDTHVHSYGSPDSTDSPRSLAIEYASNDFDFFIITDHDYDTHFKSNKILSIAGREITGYIHHTSIKGVSIILNHPAWLGRMNANDVLNDDSTLFEVWNTAAQDHDPNMDHITAEEMWNFCLSNGKLMYGVAASDNHKIESGMIDSSFVMVRADVFNEQNIIASLNNGDFYSSTGVYLDKYKPGSPYIMTVDYQLSVTSNCIFDLISAGKYRRGKITCLDEDGKQIYAWGQPYAN